jgi:hypothetical protein
MFATALHSSVRVDTSHVVHETIDGEAILIHLGTGTYYSINGAGAEVWQWLAAGVTIDGLMALASARYVATPGEVRAGIEGLIEDLLREGLLVEGPADESSASPDLAREQVPFVMPPLQVYTDMQEFMLVDPLHDVDETAGWPHVKAE